MAVLYLTEPRTTLRRAHACLAVTRGAGAAREEVLTVTPHGLELVALVGDVHITADATHSCLDEGITVAWFTAFGFGELGESYGRAWTRGSPSPGSPPGAGCAAGWRRRRRGAATFAWPSTRPPASRPVGWRWPASLWPPSSGLPPRS